MNFRKKSDLYYQIVSKENKTGLQPVSRTCGTTPFGFQDCRIKKQTVVVYLDQWTHACACVCMDENNEKHLKMMKKVSFASCAWEVHERRMRGAWEAHLRCMIFSLLHAFAVRNTQQTSLKTGMFRKLDS